jgi:hypothetical protein
VSRIWCAAAAFCLIATLASAQDGLRSASLPERDLTPPLPSATPDLFRAGRGTYVPRPPGRRDPGRRNDAVYGPGFYGPWWWPDSYPPADDRPFQRQVSNGYLQLQVVPGSAEVYVDGLYIGSANDVRQMIPGYPLEPGPHRLELRAFGYQSRAVEVRIDANDARIFRTDLEAVRSSEQPAPRVASGPPRTFYVIPNCYAGDKPPQADRLPAGCRIANTRRIPPVLNTVR